MEEKLINRKRERDEILQNLNVEKEVNLGKHYI
jgi:hypothetical protein